MSLYPSPALPCRLPDRPQVVLYEKRGLKGRSKGATKAEYDMDDPELPQLIEADLWEQLQVGAAGCEQRGCGAGSRQNEQGNPLLPRRAHTPLVHTRP